jgi:phosphoribosyl-ATP pyrophosphohydrolase
MDQPSPTNSMILPALMRVLADRRQGNPESSYVARLYDAGPEQIRAKLAEESAELLSAVAVAERSDAIVHEGADLLFHTLVLLSWAGLSLEDVEGELARRFGVSGLVEKAHRRGPLADRPANGGAS